MSHVDTRSVSLFSSGSYPPQLSVGPIPILTGVFAVILSGIRHRLAYTSSSSFPHLPQTRGSLLQQLLMDAVSSWKLIICFCLKAKKETPKGSSEVGGPMRRSITTASASLETVERHQHPDRWHRHTPDRVFANWCKTIERVWLRPLGLKIPAEC